MVVASQRVGELMQTEVVSLARGDRLDLAEDIMRLGRVRHMPVVEDGLLIGIVTSRDLLAASLSKALEFDVAERRTFLRSVDVAEAMTQDVVTIDEDTTLRDAAALMIRHQIGCLPVVKPDRTLIGLVTETDLLRAALSVDDDSANC